MSSLPAANGVRDAVSFDVPDFAKVDVREAAAKNWAELMTRIDGLSYQLARAFTLIPQRQAEMLDAGSRVEPVLAKFIEAAYVEYQAQRVGDPPIPRPVEGA